MRMESSFQYIITLDSQDLSGLPRYWKNREFGFSFFQKGKAQGICQKILKICFTEGIYLQHRENFEVLKIKECTRIVVQHSCNFLALKQYFSWWHNP